MAALFAVGYRAQEHMRPVRLGMAELRYAASIEHMTAWQRPYALVPGAIQDESPPAHGTDGRLVRQGHDSIVLPSCVGLHIYSRLLQAVGEGGHGGMRMGPCRIKTRGYRMV